MQRLGEDLPTNEKRMLELNASKAARNEKTRTQDEPRYFRTLSVSSIFSCLPFRGSVATVVSIV